MGLNLPEQTIERKSRFCEATVQIKRHSHFLKKPLFSYNDLVMKGLFLSPRHIGTRKYKVNALGRCVATKEI